MVRTKTNTLNNKEKNVEHQNARDIQEKTNFDVFFDGATRIGLTLQMSNWEQHSNIIYSVLCTIINFSVFFKHKA